MKIQYCSVTRFHIVLENMKMARVIFYPNFKTGPAVRNVRRVPESSSNSVFYYLNETKLPFFCLKKKKKAESAKKFSTQIHIWFFCIYPRLFKGIKIFFVSFKFESNLAPPPSFTHTIFLLYLHMSPFKEKADMVSEADFV